MLEKLRIASKRGLTMGSHVDMLAELYGDTSGFHIEEPLPYEAFAGRDTYYSYREWVSMIDRVANMLAGLGVKKGDRVAIIPTNGIEMLTIITAAMKMGAIAVPMNYMLRGPEIKHIVEDSGAKVLFTDPQVFEGNIRDRSVLPTVETWVMLGMGGEAPEGFESFDTLFSAADPEFKNPDLKPDDVIGIFYTSGTTGFPKGAMITSRGLLESQRRAALLLPMGKHDFGIMALPVAHIFGFAINIMGACAGVSGVLLRYFDPKKVLSLIEKHKATLFVGVPAMYALLLMSEPEKYDLSSLRMLGSSGDSMPAEHIERLRDLAARPGLVRKHKPLFAEAYGMVELTALATLKPAFRWLNWPERCIGIALPPVRVKVIDEKGDKVPAGEPGELLVKGPGVTPGYWNNPKATSAAFVGGWFDTGDMACKDRYGRVFFVDRAKDMIKCGGYSIFSVEVEQEILAHPDVEEAAVVAIPHKTMGHVPLAVVCVKKGSTLSEEDLAAWCGENIATYKAPRLVRIIPIAEMPFGMTLKVQKRELRDRFTKEYGLQG